MNDEHEQQKLALLEKAAFGKQVEAFWDSDVGKHLRHHFATCYSTAIERLKSANPTDTAAIVQAQKEAWQAEEFIQVMSQAIENGLKALDLLEGNDDAD